MPAVSGRDLLIYRGGTPIAGVRTISISVDNSPVDITSKDDSGFRTMASFAGTRALNITVEGLVKDSVLSDIAQGNGSLLLTNITMQVASGDTISGDFYMANYEQTGAHDGEVTYSVEFHSSGPWTVTAA